MKKFPKLMTLVAALLLTACGNSGSQEEPSSSSAPHKHKYVEDATLTVEATCEKEGKKVSVCECGDKKETAIPKVDHNWQKQKDGAVEDGFAKTTSYKCSFGDHYALRFGAQDFNEEATIAACGLEAKDSTYYPEVNTSGSNEGTIRLKKAEYVGQDSHVGTHVIYKVKVAAAVENAGLAFECTTKSGFSVPVFDYVANDDQQGYRKINDELVLTTKRYGLRVNGAEIELGADQYGEVDGQHGWFDWNVKFNLTAGENVIDVYCLGGYRAYINNFQLINVPANII